MSIIAIVVLYKCQIKDSKTLNSLVENYNYSPDSFQNFKVIIYDNGSASSQERISFPFNNIYTCDPSNPGLAVAYNYAMQMGVKNNDDWLLLLDQDSNLPPTFINELVDNVRTKGMNPDVVALAPKVYYKGVFFSPSRVLYGGVHRPLININSRGKPNDEIFAIGSTSLIKISFLQEIEGFNNLFWLDCLDRWLYFMIHKMEKKVVITDSRIEHDLSVLDYNRFIDKKRYNNIIEMETQFMKLYKSKGENIVYCLRLIKRMLMFSLERNKWKYLDITLNNLKKIAFKDK